MRRLKRILFTMLTVIVLMCFVAQPAFALEESEVQAQVDAVGKEAVAGNVLIWFLCAIAFLKVSQKIDSFMSSLGINVGHTGGSMLSEAMIAARSIGGFRGSSGGRSGRSSGTSGGGGEGFLAGGLAGVVSRQVTSGAVKSVTSPASGGTSASGVIGGSVYASSVAKGGSFANKVIGSVAMGDISTMGSITGSKAEQALHSYMGDNALESGATGIPSYSNVEIGGGRITGTETTAEHPEGIAFGMYSTDQYAAPEGDYETVYSADGASWYKQYAADAVKKTPYKAPDGSIAYKESIIKKLPPTPKRKDKL
ncbi:MAG: hypothetical protein UHS47_08545 [Oscillospiraceae bacterium]|nr:hypothetical protein [Oscillospiraceae bacterium]